MCINVRVTEWLAGWFDIVVVSIIFFSDLLFLLGFQIKYFEQIFPDKLFLECKV